MKFLMIVLAIHLAGELFSNRKKDKALNEEEVMNGKTRHPAEFGLREEY